MFSMQSVSQNPLIATFQLSSEVSLNLGRSQNGVLVYSCNVDSQFHLIGDYGVSNRFNHRPSILTLPGLIITFIHVCLIWIIVNKNIVIITVMFKGKEN